jgi:DNA-binding IclR family transcriptional regulator
MLNEKYVINSVIRATQVLECFSFRKPVYTFSDFHKELGFNKTTLTRVLASLEKAGFIERDSATRGYKLTYRLFQIGNVYRDQMDLYRVAHPFLSQLSQIANETVHLAILRDFNALYIGKIESTQSVRIMSQIGSSNPCYSTGVGKVMLAYLGDDQIQAFLRCVPLKRFTPRTIYKRKALMAHLSIIRKQGYAIDKGENEEEVKCVAAPIFGSNGKVIAGLSISGPSTRMTAEKIRDHFIPAVVKTARKISKGMGWISPNDSM